MQDLFTLEGRTALVTGGSRGIGEMIAEGFVRAGAKVYISARKAQACEDTARRLSAFGECIAVPADASGAQGRVPWRRATSPGSRRSIFSSTTPAWRGAPKSRRFRRAAGTRLWI